MVSTHFASAVYDVPSAEGHMPFCYPPWFRTTGYLCRISIQSSVLTKMARIGTLSVNRILPSTKIMSSPSSADIRVSGVNGFCPNQSALRRSPPLYAAAFRFIPCSSCRYGELRQSFFHLPHSFTRQRFFFPL